MRAPLTPLAILALGAALAAVAADPPATSAPKEGEQPADSASLPATSPAVLHDAVLATEAITGQPDLFEPDLDALAAASLENFRWTWSSAHSGKHVDRLAAAFEGFLVK